MRIAIVTPYYREDRVQLTRCIRSVANQTVVADHILVADGIPQAWVDDESVRHLKFDRSHGDFGNTPRGVGALLAAAERYDGIGFLDADNWLEPDHIEHCLAAAESCAGGRSNCDYVIASRNFRRPDESIMPIAEGADHADTNCFFFFRGTFAYLPHWALMPAEIASVGDLMFHEMLRMKSLTFARTNVPTVNYESRWLSHYVYLGETPPADAKPDIGKDAILEWKNGLNPREGELANRLIGFWFVKR